MTRIARLSTPLEERITPDFRASAGDDVVRAFDDDMSVVFAIDPELTLHFFNRAWEDFALANDGQHCLEVYRVGASTRAAIPQVLARFYAQAFAETVANGGAREHVYECSSPTQVRSFRMRVVALRGRSHLVVANDLIHVTDAPPAAATEHAPDYVTEAGILVQCAHCRRCRRVATGTWDWVPAFVAKPYAEVSHGLCDACLQYHYAA